ncbi:MAG: HD domain-containing protein [Gemmatimonadetes bacterium]|nr:HD domain-containing protein [Gemmatimonadota bacterium]
MTDQPAGGPAHGIALPGWAVVSPERVAHIARVEALVVRWAEDRGVSPGEAGRWRRAARLHDALRDAPDEVLARYAPPETWPRKLWHGPCAATAAEQDGETDRGVLDAVRYHSVGYRDWDDAGRMLFLADYLEPGRAHDRRALDTLTARVPREPEAALREVVARRVTWLLGHGKPIRKETWEFWNSLVAGDCSSSR